jgi:uncharacterized membrane protein YgcG
MSPASRPRGSSRAKAESESGGKKKWIALLLLLLLSFSGLGAWAMTSRRDPGLVKAQELRAQMENATPEQRRELRTQMRETIEGMSEPAREQFFDAGRKEWEARENKRMDEFFAKPYAEQVKDIDKQIDRDEQRRKDWEKRRQANAANGQAGRGGQGGGGGGRGGPGGGGGGGRGGAGGRGGGRNLDPAAQLARSKNYLDRTSPESRAQRGEYRRMMQDRRTQRGLQ